MRRIPGEILFRLDLGILDSREHLSSALETAVMHRGTGLFWSYFSLNGFPIAQLNVPEHVLVAGNDRAGHMFCVMARN